MIYLSEIYFSRNHDTADGLSAILSISFLVWQLQFLRMVGFILDSNYFFEERQEPQHTTFVRILRVTIEHYVYLS